MSSADDAVQPPALAAPDEQRALNDQWRALRRSATLVAVFCSPAAFLWLWQVQDVAFGWALVATDLLAFVGTAVAGLVILLTGWDRVDPIAGLLVAALMFWAAYGLIRESTRIFLEASPGNIDPDEVARAIVAVPGVREVHDLHVWTLTSGFPVLSAHVLVASGADCHGVRRGLEAMLGERFGLEHSTLQVEHASGPVQLGPSFRRREALPQAPPGKARRRA